MKSHASNNSVAVLGFHDGSAGQIVSWFERTSPYRIACFINEAVEFVLDPNEENKKRVSQRTDYPQNGLFKERPFIVSLNWIGELKKRGIFKVLPLTPNNRQRLRQIELCHSTGIELVSAIHPTATILPEARIEPGVWINARAIVGYKSDLAPGCIVNTGAQIDHHNVLESCCQVDPGVVTAGFVTLRACSHVHTGSVIINRVEIGHDSIVGAGAVVTKNILPNCTAVGVPARVIRYRK